MNICYTRRIKKTEQILNCSQQLRMTGRGTKYLINIDYPGTYNAE